MGLQLSWDRRDTLWLGANLHFCETTIQDLAYPGPSVIGSRLSSSSSIPQLDEPVSSIRLVGRQPETSHAVPVFRSHSPRDRASRNDQASSRTGAEMRAAGVP